MSQTFSLPPDAQARMDMRSASLSESRRHGANGAKRELPLTEDGQAIGDDGGAGCDDCHGGDLAATAALVEEAIRRRIEGNGTCPFYFNEVTCECSSGVLKVHGRVPTDRLKNVLWSLIQDLDGITEIDDRLDVVSSTGLSSVRPR